MDRLEELKLKLLIYYKNDEDVDFGDYSSLERTEMEFLMLIEQLIEKNSAKIALDTSGERHYDKKYIITIRGRKYLKDFISNEVWDT